MKKNCKKLVSIMLTLLLTVSLAFGATPQSVMAKSQNQTDIKALVKQAIAQKIKSNSSGVKSKVQKSSDEDKLLKQGKPDDIVRVIVQLQDKPSIEKGAKSLSSIKASQQTVIQKVKNLQNASIKKTFGYLVNGFSMSVKRSEISKIKAIPGVKSVTEAQKYTPDMNFAKNLTQAYGTWKDLGYKGEGMVIAIVDTGIDYTHKDMVITDTSKEKLHQSDIAALGGKGKFFTDKVPYGYNFADNNQSVIDTNASEQHGMHVAGIVAANGNEEDVKSFKAIQGVAPEAQLLAMKVFSNNPDGNEYCYDDDVIAAIEDSVAHKADVINMSLGATAGFVDENNPEQIAIKNATDNGTLVVISAGNSAISTTNNGWNDPQTNLLKTVDTETVGDPGLSKDSLCVASYENSDLTVSIMDYTTAAGETGTVAYAPAMGSPENTLNTPHSIVDCGIGEDDENGNDFANVDVAGKIALIKRGTLSFSDKVKNAEKYGAIGVIIYDKDKSVGGSDDPLSSMSLDPDLYIPIVGIGNASGNQFVTLLQSGDVQVAFTGKKGSVPSSTANEMSPYTSWGPTPSLDFKPEITAPGGDIYSTQNNNTYTTMSGTSMAAPHTSGSEALILEAAKKNLGLTGRELVEYAKNTAINTAKVEMDKNNPTVPYSPRQQGSGMIQIEDAIKNNVIVTDDSGDAAVALKEIGSTKTFDLNLKNYGDKDVAYTLSSSGVLGEQLKGVHFNDYVISGSSITFSSDSVVIPAHQSKKISVTVTLPSSFATEQFAEGFIKFGSIDSTVPSLSVPFIGFYGNWSTPAIFDKPIWDSENTLIGAEGLISGNTYLGTTGVDKYDYPIIDPDKIAFSTDMNNSIYTDVTPVLSLFRNAKTMNVDVVDKNDGSEKVLQNVFTENNVRKDTIEDSSGFDIYSNGSWLGNLYDQSKGQYVPAQDGQYYLRFTAKVDLPDATPQTLYMPVKIDSVAPTISITSETISEDKTQCTVKWKATDNTSGVGIDPLNMVVVINNKPSDSDVNYDDSTDEFSCTLPISADTPNDLIIGGTDYAGNIAFAEEPVECPVTFNNLSDNLLLSADSLNKETGKYEVNGTVSSDVDKLTINGVEAGFDESHKYFSAEIALNEGENTVNVAAYDKDGQPLPTTASYTVKLLTKAPVVTITSPTDDPYSVTDQDTVTVTGNVKFEEDSAKNAVTVNSSVGPGDNLQYNSKTGDFSADVPVDGLTFVDVDAIDEAGNETAEIITVIATMNVEPLVINFDNLAPSMILNKQDVENDTFTISGTVNHNPKIFQINGEDITVNPDLTFSKDFNLDQGKNKFTVYAVDTDDTVMYDYMYFVEYDSNAPQVTITDPLIQSDGKIYTNKDTIEIKGSAMDNTYGFILAINGNTIINSDNTPEKGEGNKKSFDYSVPVKDGDIMTIEAMDEFGNFMDPIQIPVVVDKTAPVKPVVTLSSTAPTNKSLTAAIAADPSDNDVEKLEYSFDNSTWTTYTDPVAINANGTIYARATDKAGNVSDATKLDITNIDKTAPKAPLITLSTMDPTNKPVTATIAADSSDKDVAKLEYSFDNKAWKDYTAPVTIDANTTMYARATDNVGNVSDTAKINVTNIYKVAPAITITGVEEGKTYYNEVTPSISASSAANLTVSVVSLLDGKAYDGSKVTTLGKHTLSVTATDAAGNVASANVNFTIQAKDIITNSDPAVIGATIDSSVNNTNTAGGGTVLVDLTSNPNAELPKATLDNLKGKDVTLSVSVPAPANLTSVVWTINGKDITGDTKDLILSLNNTPEYQGAINNIDSNSLVLSFSSKNGVLPGNAQVEIKAPWLQGKSKVFLYYYNPTTKKAELMKSTDNPDGSYNVVNGTVTITINHCSDYFLSALAPNSADKTNLMPKTGSMVNFGNLVGLGAVIALLGVVIIFRRKKETD